MTTIPKNYTNVRAEIIELLKNAPSAASWNINSITTATAYEIDGRSIVLK